MQRSTSVALVAALLCPGLAAACTSAKNSTAAPVATTGTASPAAARWRASMAR